MVLTLDGYFLEHEQVWTFANSDNSGKLEEEPGNLTSYSEEAREKGKAALQLIGRKRSGEGSKSAKRTKVNNGKNAEAGKDESDHDSHIWTERERRKKMRDMFATLHSLLPHLPHKADKSTIVDEAINYISKLQDTFQKLQKQKSERIGAIGIGHQNPPQRPPNAGIGHQNPPQRPPNPVIGHQNPPPRPNAGIGHQNPPPPNADIGHQHPPRPPIPPLPPQQEIPP